MVKETKKDDKSKLKELIDRLNTTAIRQHFKGKHPPDISAILEELSTEEIVTVFRRLEPAVASEVFLSLSEQSKEAVLDAISSTELVEVVEEMDTDDAADVISELPLEDARKVLESIDKHESIELQKLLAYPDDTAGGKMQTELISVTASATVGEVIDVLRDKGEEVENVSNVFIVDEENVLTGAVPLNKIVITDPAAKIKTITVKDPHKVHTDLDQEEVAMMFKKYDLLSLPVVDSDEKLVGRITIDDIVDVLEEEASEDIYRLASVSVGERALDPPLRSFGLRVPWLLLNLVTAFAAAGVVKYFESTIETLVILAVFMPVVAGLGGNAATQAITVIVRGIALGELTLDHSRRILVKETLVGLANGVVVGLVAALSAYLFGVSLMMGVLLMLSMTANLLIAGLAGALIPLFLKSLKADPALSASVFVTAFTDVGGFASFLGLAALFLKMGLL